MISIILSQRIVACGRTTVPLALVLLARPRHAVIVGLRRAPQALPGARVVVRESVRLARSARLRVAPNVELEPIHVRTAASGSQVHVAMKVFARLARFSRAATAVRGVATPDAHWVRRHVEMAVTGDPVAAPRCPSARTHP